MNVHRIAVAVIGCGLLWFAPAVNSQPQRRVLTAADLEYVGAMRVPIEASGYGRYGLTHRYVGGQLRFIVSGHRLENDPVLEFDAPGYAPNWEDAPRASLVQWWGDIYDGRKIVTEQGGQVWTEDLEWFNGRLFWTYGDPYPVAQYDDPSIGYSVLGGAAFGPWRTTMGAKLTRGYATTIPQWYANAYTGGRRLGVGSGLRSGNIASSWGPNLNAIPDPSTIPPVTPLSALPLVQYSFWDRLNRPDTYIPHTEFDYPGGVWTQMDFIESGVWVDTPEVHGVIFSCGLAEGNTWYGVNPDATYGWEDPCGEWTGPHAERYEKRWWIYDPMSFVPVAGGEPHAVRPASLIDPNVAIPGTRITGACFGAATGATFEPSTQMLYMIYPDTEEMGFENLPVIYAFRVRGGGGAEPRANLSLWNFDWPEPVQSGATLSYLVWLYNGGNAAATWPVVRNEIPLNTTFESLAVPPGWSCWTPGVGQTGTIVCWVSSLAPGGSAGFTLRVRVNQPVETGTVVWSIATVWAETLDPDPNDNWRMATTMVVGPGSGPAMR